MRSLLFLGTLPPPVGGVTIHVMRLIDQLRQEGITCELIDLRQGGNYKYLLSILQLLGNQNSIVHYQLNNWKESAVFSFISWLTGKKFISTIHSFPQEYKELTFFNKIAIKITKLFTIKFIAPSNTIRKKLLQAGINEKKIEIINTFLPPTSAELEEEIPEEILEFVKGKKKIILANAYKLYLNEKGEDVYGLDLCIKASRDLKNVAFIFICPLVGNEDYYQQCMKEIDKNIFLFVNKKVSLVSLFKIADLFVRPTVSDSFGVSVGEALYCGVPAVASNVCERAKGTVLFEKGNLDDFLFKIKLALDKKVESEVDMIDYWNQLYIKL